MSRFVGVEGEAEIGEVEYREGDEKGVVSLNRVEVHKEYRGKGKAGELMNCLTEYLRDNNLKAIAVCPYAVAFYKRHPELCDVLFDDK